MASVLDSYTYCHYYYTHKGLSVEELAKRAKVSVPTAYRALNKHGLIK